MLSFQKTKKSDLNPFPRDLLLQLNIYWRAILWSLKAEALTRRTRRTRLIRLTRLAWMTKYEKKRKKTRIFRISSKQGLGKSGQLSIYKALRLSICIRCISLLLQLGESVQRFFHRGLLLHPSLVPRKCPVSTAWALMQKPDPQTKHQKKGTTDGAGSRLKKRFKRKEKKKRWRSELALEFQNFI